MTDLSLELEVVRLLDRFPLRKSGKNDYRFFFLLRRAPPS